jgi:DNA polymerase-4
MRTDPGGEQRLPAWRDRSRHREQSGSCSVRYAHPMERRVLHLDIDAFLASLEQIRDPGLKGRPVVVGSGVVASRSYEAKARGVETAMGMAEARRRCPELVVREGDSRLAERYRQAVAAVVRRYTPVVEVSSLDDLYAELTGTPFLLRAAVADPTAALAEPTVRPLCAELRAAVRRETGLSVAQGVGSTRTVARLATMRAKPGGICEVPPGRELEFLGGFAVQDLPGVGPRSAELLHKLGLRQVRELWPVERELLVRTFGARGEDIYWRCRGLDAAPVVATPALPSISRETSFEPRHDDQGQQTSFLRAMLAYLVDRAASELRRLGLRCRTVQVRLRHVDGAQGERRRSLAAATDRTGELGAVARALLDGLLLQRRVLVRLCGVTLATLERPLALQGELFAGPEQRRGRLDAAVDAIRARHGFGRVVLGESAGLLGKLPHGPHGFRLRTPSLSR